MWSCEINGRNILTFKNNPGLPLEVYRSEYSKKQL